jgi:mannose-1-phosphate guanylyltransferase/mannose-6-phosphate isomerase
VAATIRPVILSGGSGTRLWPLSTPERPKQFLDLVGKPLFDLTLDRALRVAGDERVIIVTGGEQVPTVENALAARNVAATLLVEPTGRNTAPAVLAAALVSDPADVLLVMPSDHLIADAPAFTSAVKEGVEMAGQGSLVTFGIVPTRPETGYGYIEQGAPAGPGFRVTRFKEKPDAGEAARLVGDGRHLWNSGIFVFQASALLAEANRQAPDIVEGVQASLPSWREGTLVIGDGFSAIRSISIDHALMEGAEDVVVVPLDAGWSDIGSWQSVWELGEHDGAGNTLIGDVVAVDVRGSYVRAGSKTVAVAGVEDLVVVETPDVVLIVPRDRSQLVRDLAVRSGGDRRAD